MNTIFKNALMTGIFIASLAGLALGNTHSVSPPTCQKGPISTSMNPGEFCYSAPLWSALSINNDGQTYSVLSELPPTPINQFLPMNKVVSHLYPSLSSPKDVTEDVTDQWNNSQCHQLTKANSKNYYIFANAKYVNQHIQFTCHLVPVSSK